MKEENWISLSKNSMLSCAVCGNSKDKTATVFLNHLSRNKPLSGYWLDNMFVICPKCAERIAGCFKK
jgi:hypothetical protein